MYLKVNFEIYDGCNAACPWCSTGALNIGGREGVSYISTARFREALCELKRKQLITKETIVSLYNYGEPFLHPNFEEILHICCEENVYFTISTNASVYKHFASPDVCKYLKHMCFSMQGFSQASYTRIHGFNFDKILKNIETFVRDLREYGYSGGCHISYHVYQFNLLEIYDAALFAVNNRIMIIPLYAYFADFKVFEKYMSGTLPYKQLEKISKELMLHHIDDFRKMRPKTWVCPEPYDTLTINSDCDILTCCVIDKEVPCFSVGNLFKLSKEEIARLKQTQEICNRCRELDIDFLTRNPRFFPIIEKTQST